MKKTLIKISVSISLIMVSLSIGYYFLFFLPTYKQEILLKENTDQILKKNIDCQQFSKDIKEEWEKDTGQYQEVGDVEELTVDSIFYSPKLNSCMFKFYSRVRLRDGSYIIRNSLRDVFTSEEVIECTISLGKGFNNSDCGKFNERLKEYK